MMGLISSFGSLPRPMQAMFSLFAGAGVLGALAVLGVDPPVLLVIAIGVIVVVLAVLAYRWILGRLKKRKAEPFERELKESGGAVPQTVSDVADRARLDEMRKKFEVGLATFRERGKDIYSLPWYVIIGEPGSGKTEAIRHCGIGFPPGLQNELQGTGGTINMDRWFTTDAIILDTAGRLTFGEGHAADNREWTEFLRLLRKSRANCPINGLLIAIPCDSLVQDSSEEIEHKAGKLARQLDVIQNSLGVRFPVFVVVTKADLVLGFRQFFAELRDPDVQGQIVGWSNPDPLDAAFDPATIERHLQGLTDRLKRRRLTLLKDPVHTENPDGRRLEEVDELYAYPQELMSRLTSRLRRYLEQVFVGGEWSSKPLFLRGIYLTSSMQEGAALDAELAEALGVPVESLPGGDWREDRALFLHDVFKQKVFRERSLVTNASNTRARQRKRRRLVIGTGSIAAALLVVLVAFGYAGYRSDIKPVREFWQRASKAGTPTIIVPGKKPGTVEYQGDYALSPDDPETRLALLRELRVQAGREFRPRLGLAWIGTFRGEGGGFESQRRAAGQKIFEDAALLPTVTLLADRFDSGVDAWSDDHTTAFAQLVDVAASASDPAPRGPDGRRFDFDPAFTLLLGDAITAEVHRDAVGALEDLSGWLYVEDAGDQPWPSDRVARAVTESALRQGFDDFTRRWGTGDGRSEDLETILALHRELASFAEIEAEILAINCPEGAPPEVVQAAVRDWEEQALFDRLAAAKVAVDDAIAAVADGPFRAAWNGDDGGLRAVLDAGWRQDDEAARAAFAELLAAAIGEASVDPGALAPPDESGDETAIDGGAWSARIRTAWGDRQRDAEEDRGAVEGAASTFDAGLLARRREDKLRAYELRFRMYEAAAGALARSGSATPAFGQTAALLEEIGQSADSAVNEIDGAVAEHGLRPDDESPAATAQARAQEISTCLARLGGGLKSQEAAVRAFIEKLGAARDADALGRLVALDAEGRDALPDVGVPLTRLEEGGVKTAYHPAAGAALFADWEMVRQMVGGRALSGDLEAEVDALQPAVDDYANAYTGYWCEKLIEELRPAPESWTAFDEALRKHASSARAFRRTLDNLADLAETALGPLIDARPDSFDVRADDVRRRADRLRLALGQGDARLDDATLDECIANWNSLPTDKLEARSRLETDLRDPDFERHYFFGEDDPAFWDNFTLGALDLLETEIREWVLGSARELQELARGFPLTRLPKAQSHLSPEELARARVIVAGLTITPATDQALKDMQLRDAIDDTLRGILSPRSGIGDDRLNALRDLLEALPGADERAEVEVAVIWPEDDDESTRATAYWRNLTLEQDGRIIADQERIRNDAPVLGRLTFPAPDGGRVAFGFHVFEGDPRDEGVVITNRRTDAAREGRPPTFAGYWSPLLLLWDLGDAQTTDGGLTWRVRMEVSDKTDEARRGNLYLKLTFRDPIPLSFVKPTE